MFLLISIWYSINILIYLLHAIWIKFSLPLILILLKYVNQQTPSLKQCLHPCLLLPWAKGKYLHAKNPQIVLKSWKLYITRVNLNRLNNGQLKMKPIRIKYCLNLMKVNESPPMHAHHQDGHVSGWNWLRLCDLLNFNKQNTIKIFWLTKISMLY